MSNLKKNFKRQEIFIVINEMINNLKYFSKILSNLIACYLTTNLFFNTKISNFIIKIHSKRFSSKIQFIAFKYF